MRKNLLMTICTFAIAGGTIAGSTGLTTFALAANNTETSISAEKITQPVTIDNRSKVTIDKWPSSKIVEAKRTSADMNEEKATYIALEALEKKYNISLNGTLAWPTLGTWNDYNGLGYYVTFTSLEQENMGDYKDSKNGGKNPWSLEQLIKYREDHPIYIAFLDSKTGKVISAEKNPGLYKYAKADK